MFVTQLKSFFWVARLGSITQAARQLGLSQPTVTAQIKALEEHYGVELFHRQGGRLTVSGEGLQLLPQVELLLLRAAGRIGAAPRRRWQPGRAAAHRGHGAVLRAGHRAALCPAVPARGGEHRQRQFAPDDSGAGRYQVDLATSSHLDTDPRLLRLELGRDPLALVVHRQHRWHAARP
jgi:DNA-binding transcriptional LysR family regulator